MWAGVYEFAESTGYERLEVNVRHQDCVPRPDREMLNISKVAVALSMNIGLQCVSALISGGVPGEVSHPLLEQNLGRSVRALGCMFDVNVVVLTLCIQCQALIRA